MAAACSEGSPTNQNVNNIQNSENNDRTTSRSPSLSSIKDFQWTDLLVLKPGKKKLRKFKGKHNRLFM